MSRLKNQWGWNGICFFIDRSFLSEYVRRQGVETETDFSSHLRSVFFHRDGKIQAETSFFLMSLYFYFLMLKNSFAILRMPLFIYRHSFLL